MKRILIFILLAFLCSVGFSQTTYPVTQTLGAPKTLVTSRGGLKADSSLILPEFPDTVSANISTFINKYAGTLIRVKDTVYIRNESTTKWNVFGSGGSGGSGTVTSISQGYGMTNTPNPITTTGTIKVDSATLSTKYLRIADTTNMLVKYLRKADTTAMLLPYLRKSDTTAMLSKYLRRSDTTTMLLPYLRKIDTASLSNRINTKIDSLKRSSDSVYGKINGVWKYFYKDSVGNSIPTLQQVLTKGNTATNTNIELYGNGYIIIGDLSSYNSAIYGDNIAFANTTNNSIGSYAIDQMFFSNGTKNSTIYPSYNNQNDTFPTASGRLALSVNGVKADSTGNITLSSGSGTVTSVASGYGLTSSPSPITTSGTITVDTATLSNKYLRIVDTSNRWVNNITRTAGKDSIIFYKDGNRFAIKDSVGTNPAPVGYYGAFQDNTSQTAASINTAYAVKLNTTDLTNGVSVVNDGSSNPTRVTLANTGIYNIQFSLQLEKTGGSGNMIADIWIRKNGVDIPSTTGKVVLTGSANASPVVAAWNYVLDLAAGDYIQLMWATSNTNVEIVAAVATSPHPAIPSAILTVTQQSGIMAGTGITAINGLTGAAQTLSVDSTNSTFKITSTGTSHTFTIPNASTSGVTRGLLSNTQYTTFNSKIGASDTATMLSKYLNLTNYGLSKSGQVVSADTTKLSTLYQTNLKVNISDTATMLTPYLRKADTTAMLSKYLRIADTSSLQRKSIGAYSFQANNTNAAANTTSNTFRDTTGVYSGTITWTGTTAPSGATTHTYSWTQIGKMVTLRINLVYANAGVGLTQVAMALPSGCPNPIEPTGLGAANEILYGTYGYLLLNSTTQNAAFQRAYLRVNAADNGYELIVAGGGAAYKLAYVTINYFTN